MCIYASGVTISEFPVHLSLKQRLHSLIHVWPITVHTVFGVDHNYETFIVALLNLERRGKRRTSVKSNMVSQEAHSVGFPLPTAWPDVASPSENTVSFVRAFVWRGRMLSVLF